jgi:hypothetical protein
MITNFSKGYTLDAEVPDSNQHGRQMEIDPAIGLCSGCQHCRIVKSERSTFYLCRLSLTNPEFRKYPPLPVWRCSGHRPGAGAAGDPAPDDKLTE